MHTIASAAPAAGHGTQEGFETVTLSAGPLEAAFAPGLGMAGVSLRHAGDELLDRQAGLRAYARTGAVMGVPLLYPWANRLAGHGYTLDGRHVGLPPGPPLVHCEEHGLPIHGLLNASPHWQITMHDVRRVRARLGFGEHPELLAAFPSRTCSSSRPRCQNSSSASPPPCVRPQTPPCRSRSASTPPYGFPARRASAGRSRSRPAGT
jgi:Aldose 1-epimerase